MRYFGNLNITNNYIILILIYILDRSKRRDFDFRNLNITLLFR